MSTSLWIAVVAEESMAQEIADSLRQSGHQASIARDPAQALALGSPDAVVLALAPPACGLDLVEAYLQRGERPVFIALTDRASPVHIRRALRLGVDDWLQRPFHLEEIVAAVQSAALRRSHGLQPSPGLFRRSFVSDAPDQRRICMDLLAQAQMWGLPPSTRGRMGTALAEILDNSCAHAYPESRGSVWVEARRGEGEVLVTVTDEGVGVDAVELASKAMLGAHSDGPCGGLARAAALTEELRLLNNTPRGTRVELRFQTYPTAFEGDALVDLSEFDYLTPVLARRILRAASGQADDDLVNLPPTLAVTVGRLLLGVRKSDAINAALWI